jgi:hypothetical protein
LLALFEGLLERREARRHGLRVERGERLIEGPARRTEVSDVAGRIV